MKQYFMNCDLLSTCKECHDLLFIQSDAENGEDSLQLTKVYQGCARCSALFSPLTIVTVCIVLLEKVILPVSLCGTPTTLLSVLFRVDLPSCDVLSWISLLNAILLVTIVTILAYVVSFAYQKHQAVIVKLTCAVIYAIPLILLFLALAVRIAHALGIVVVDLFTVVWVMWSTTGSIVSLTFFVESSSTSLENALVSWRNTAIIIVAVAGSFCLLLLSEGSLYAFFLLMIGWDILAVYWIWGPIRLMLDHHKYFSNNFLLEQPQIQNEIDLLREIAKDRRRDILMGIDTKDLDNVLEDVTSTCEEQFLSAKRMLELPPGLSYQYQTGPHRFGVTGTMGVLDIVLLGVLLGLAAKRPGLCVVFACYIAALVGAAAATLQSIVGQNTVPALPAALGICLITFVLCHAISLQNFVDQVVSLGLYF